MNSNFEDNEITITLEGRISRIMEETGVGRHQAHIQACRELNLAEERDDDRVSGRLNRVAGLAVIGLFSLTLGLGAAAAQALAGTAGDCPVDSPANPLCTPRG